MLSRDGTGANLSNRTMRFNLGACRRRREEADARRFHDSTMVARSIGCQRKSTGCTQKSLRQTVTPIRRTGARAARALENLPRRMAKLNLERSRVIKLCRPAEPHERAPRARRFFLHIAFELVALDFVMGKHRRALWLYLLLSTANIGSSHS